MRKKWIVSLAILSCFIFIACGKQEPLEIENPTPVVQEDIQIDIEPKRVPAAEPAPVVVSEPDPIPTFNVDIGRHDAIYNHDLMVAVYLGMSKDELEGFFAPAGDASPAGYVPYDDYNFFVEYWGNDTVRMVIVYERGSWVTFNGVTAGSALVDIVANYGEPLAVEGNYYVYYTYHNELLKEAPSYTEVDVNYLYSIRVIVEDDVVKGVTISRF